MVARDVGGGELGSITRRSGMHHRDDGLASSYRLRGQRPKAQTDGATLDAIVGRFQREMWNIRSLLT
jgi:hypothetical protein